jgi:hypothetical protein
MEIITPFLICIKSTIVIKLKKIAEQDIWYFFQIYKILNYSKKEKISLGVKRTVKLSGNFPGLWRRTLMQTPNGSCQFGKTLFVASGDAEYCLVLNKEPLNFTKPPSCEAVWGLHMEPELYIKKFGYQKSSRSLINRFYTSSSKLIKKKGVYISSPPYVHFHLGKNWDFLDKCNIPIKTIDIGIIISDLNELPGHRNRLNFLDEIDKSDLNVSIWGRGNNLYKYKNYKGFIYNKWDVYKKCKYTIVLENTISDFYWTEKITDALLAYTLPFYYGSELIHKYLPSKSIISIDIMKNDVVDFIKDNIKNKEYEKRLTAISEARKKILHEQNLYAFIDKEIEKVEGAF